MKYPPRFASRQLPPHETPAPSRRLIAGAIFVAGFAIAVLGAFHGVRSTGKEPTTHLPPYSPLPTAGSFQVLGNPEPSPTLEARPSPSAALVLRQQPTSPTPALTVAPVAPVLPPVQNWSPAAVLTPGVPAGAATTDVGASTPSYNPGPASLQASPTPIPTPTPQPTATPTPTPQPPASPTPTPKPSPTSTPQPSTTPTPQPSASAGSPSCVPTKHHPCKQRGDTR